MSHAIGKESGVLFAAKVEPPHLPGIPPLVEVVCGLVILETFHDWTVYNHLLVRLHLASHYPEGIGGRVVIDLDSAEGLRPSARRQPLLIAIVIDHHSGPSLANTRLTHCSARVEILSS